MSYRHIDGVEGLQARLLQLPAKLEAKILRGALRAGAVVMKKSVDPLIPRRSGRLARTSRVSTRSRHGLVTASAKVGDSRAYYGHILQRGAQPHAIRARNKPFLHLQGDVFVRQVNHPGIRPNPFMQLGMERGTTPAIAAVAAYVRQRLAQAVT
jgi:hypothetical protein